MLLNLLIFARVSELFVKSDGELYKEGDMMTRPKLADTLARVAAITSMEELQGIFSDMAADIQEHGDS